MNTPSQCLEEIRRAVRSDGDADLRAITILKAARNLEAVPASANQSLALRTLSRVALTMAGLGHDDLRRFDTLSDLAKAWMAFEDAWYDDEGRPLEIQEPLGTRRLAAPRER